VVYGGDPALFGGSRRQQPARRDQQDRPHRPRHELQCGVPPWPQRADGTQAERAVDEQLQAGDRARRAQPGDDRRHGGDDHEGRDRDPAVTVDHRPRHQARGAAEHGSSADPDDPRPVRSAGVDHDAEQRARRGQRDKLAAPGEETGRERHPDREHGADHVRPGRRHLLRPDDVGEPARYHLAQPVGNGDPGTVDAPHASKAKKSGRGKSGRGMSGSRERVPA
jgi:hypothetical protein